MLYVIIEHMYIYFKFLRYFIVIDVFALVIARQLSVCILQFDGTRCATVVINVASDTDLRTIFSSIVKFYEEYIFIRFLYCLNRVTHGMYMHIIYVWINTPKYETYSFEVRHII